MSDDLVPVTFHVPRDVLGKLPAAVSPGRDADWYRRLGETMSESGYPRDAVSYRAMAAAIEAAESLPPEVIPVTPETPWGTKVVPRIGAGVCRFIAPAPDDSHRFVAAGPQPVVGTPWLDRFRYDQWRVATPEECE